MYIYHKDIVFPKKKKYKKIQKNTNHYTNYIAGKAAKHNRISPKDNLYEVIIGKSFPR